METIKLFQKKVNWLILFAVALPFFSYSFYLLKNLPANVGLACSTGGYFNFENLLFSAIYSLLLGVLVVGFIEIVQRKRKRNAGLKAASTGLLSVMLVGLTTICTMCILPALTLFGLNISLAIFTTYNFYFKISALIVLLISIYFLEQNLKTSCILSKCKLNV
jgi:hypothetical protein